MKKFFLIFVFFLFFFSMVVFSEVPVCGDGTCNENETVANCFADCLPDTCYDSDEENTDNKRIIGRTVVSDGTVFVDECLDGTTLQERVCSGNTVVTLNIPCENGCVSGICRSVGESFRNAHYESEFAVDESDTANCSNQNACVFLGKCYDEGSKQFLQWNASFVYDEYVTEVCKQGMWFDCETNKDCKLGAYCSTDKSCVNEITIGDGRFACGNGRETGSKLICCSKDNRLKISDTHATVIVKVDKENYDTAKQFVVELNGQILSETSVLGSLTITLEVNKLDELVSEDFIIAIQTNLPVVGF